MGNPHDLYAPEVGTPKAKADNVPCRFSALPAVLPTPFGENDRRRDMIEHFGRRCQGWFEDDDGHREQCDFRKIARNVTQKMILPPAVAAMCDTILVILC